MTDRLQYGTTAKVFHWLIVALLLVQYPLGWLMPDIHRGMKPGDAMTFHISIGIMILVLIVLRFAWRLTHPVAPESSLPPWQRVSSEAMHWLLYALVLATTITGWLFASFRGWSVSFFFLCSDADAERGKPRGRKNDRWLAPGHGMVVAGGDRPARRGGTDPSFRLPRPRHAPDVAGIASVPE